MINKGFPEKNEIVICEVRDITKTSVFVKLIDHSKEGVINLSEISPGRIRNVRDYVNPGQIIVCKVLRIDENSGHIDLSLRRVSQKEKKEALDSRSKEKSLKVFFNVIINDEEKVNQLLGKISEKYSFIEFLDIVAQEPKEEITKILSHFADKPTSEKLGEMLKSRIKEKRVFVKAKVMIRCGQINGVEIIKNVLNIAEKEPKAKINYLGSPNFSLIVEDKNYKEANKTLNLLIENIETNAKKEGCFIEIIKEKK